MNAKKFWGAALGLALLSLTVPAATSYAQGGGGGGGGGFQQMDPAQMRQMMVDRFKDQITATDDEWKVISPLLDKYFEKTLAQAGSGLTAGGIGGMFGRGGGRGGRGGPGGAGGGGGRGGLFGGTPAPEATALQTAAADDKATNDDLKAKVKAFRDAKEKQEKELKETREALRKVLSVRQEAQFIVAGVLD